MSTQGNLTQLRLIDILRTDISTLQGCALEARAALGTGLFCCGSFWPLISFWHYIHLILS